MPIGAWAEEATPAEAELAAIAEPLGPSHRPESSPAEAGALPASLKAWRITPRSGRFGRGPLHIDPLHAALVRETWSLPSDASAADVTGNRWLTAESGDGPWLRHEALHGGYACASVNWPRDEVVMLDASGHAMAYVNAAPFAGDPYLTGRIVVPIALRKGTNQLVFHVADGALRAELVRPNQAATVDLRDAVFPDMVRGESGVRFASILIVNASNEPLVGAQVTAVRAGGHSVTASVGAIAPLAQRRVAIPIDGELSLEEARSDAVRVQLDLAIPNAQGGLQRIDSSAFDLAVVDANELQLRTFLSDVDGSVQCYHLLPADVGALGDVAQSPPGLVISLHGAGERPERQLADVQPLPWAHVIAPLGRRVEGNDWEGMSRRDAMEALQDVLLRTPVDPRRISLAGTGAGGHGALRMAALFPDRFAAIASLGGWSDYASYGNSLPQWSAPNRIERLLERCAQSTSLPPLLNNLMMTGVSIQHRVDDEVVPLSEAQRLRTALASFHPDFAYRELFGAASIEVDGSLVGGEEPERFLRDRTLPVGPQVDHVSYAVYDLSQGRGNRWLTILAQQTQQQLSRAELVYMAPDRGYLGITDNVAALALDVSALAPGEPINAILDGQPLDPIPWPQADRKEIVFERIDGRWQHSLSSSPRRKSPDRPGGFHTVFDRHPLLVYGTQGTSEENAWSMAKARFDAQTFWVRVGGTAEVIADVDFQEQLDRNRNVVVYGNSDSNRAWAQLLSTSPVQVRRGLVRIGRRPEKGDALGCLLVQPRAGSSTAVVGAISGTGLAGMRATDRLPYFVAGVMIPDLLVFDLGAIEKGTSEVRAAGFFGNDWSVEKGEIVWRDAAL